MKSPRPLLQLAAAFAAAALARAADWSHIAGPNFNRTTAEKAPGALAGGALKKIWEISARGGFSSFVTGGGRVYTVLPIEGLETLVALDRKTGQTAWQAPLVKPTYGGIGSGDRGTPDNNGGDGPRATPVFADGRVFVFDGMFTLHAFDAATGKLHWQHDLIKEFGGRVIQWGNAAAPLVLRDRVIVSGGSRGQSVLAFRADTGAVLWKTGDDQATHSTPVAATIHGQEQVLLIVGRGLVSRDPTDGRELWHYPFPHRTSTAASPVVWLDIVNVAAAYGVGGGACKVTREGDKWSCEELWRSPGDGETASHWSTAVVHDGFLYGCYGRAAPGANPFKCVDIRTGKTLWQKNGFGPSQVILAGGRLLATTDAGVVKIIEPSPKAYEEIASAKLIEGKVWATLILSDGQLFLRSTKQGVCYEL